MSHHDEPHLSTCTCVDCQPSRFRGGPMSEMSTNFAKLKFVTGYTPWQKAHDDGYTVCTLDEWPIAEYRLIELNAALDAAEVLQQRVAQAEYLRDLAGREHRHCMADRDALRERVAALEADLKRVLTEGGVAVMDMLVTERARVAAVRDYVTTELALWEPLVGRRSCGEPDYEPDGRINALEGVLALLAAPRPTATEEP